MKSFGHARCRSSDGHPIPPPAGPGNIPTCGNASMRRAPQQAKLDRIGIDLTAAAAIADGGTASRRVLAGRSRTMECLHPGPGRQLPDPPVHRRVPTVGRVRFRGLGGRVVRSGLQLRPYSEDRYHADRRALLSVVVVAWRSIVGSDYQLDDAFSSVDRHDLMELGVDESVIYDRRGIEPPKEKEAIRRADWFEHQPIHRLPQ